MNQADKQLDLVSDSPAKPAQPKVAGPTETEAEADGETETEAETETDAETDAEAASLASPTARDDEDARQVSREEAEAYAKESNLLFFEASAKVSAAHSRLGFVLMY